MGSCRVTYEDMVSHPEIWGTKLPKWADELAARGYKGVCAVDFYGDIFGEDLETERMPEDYRRGEYAGIAIEKVKKTDESGKLVLDNKGNPRYIGKRYTITKGNMKLYNLIDQSDNFCMIAPISYAGRVRKNENAHSKVANIASKYNALNGKLEEVQKQLTKAENRAEKAEERADKLLEKALAAAQQPQHTKKAAAKASKAEAHTENFEEEVEERGQQKLIEE